MSRYFRVMAHRALVFFCAAVSGPGHAESVVTDIPRFAYVANAFDSSLSVFSVDARTGSLRHIGHAPTAKFPTTIAADAEHGWVYVATKVIDDLSIYRSDPLTGKLTWIKESQTYAGRSPSGMLLHPLKRLLYISLGGGAVQGMLRNAQNGFLTPVPGSPFAAGPRARMLALHPNGVFLYVANTYSNDVSAYRIDTQSGSLSPLPGMPFASGDSGHINPTSRPLVDAPPESGGAPYHVAVDPAGKFLYTANFYGGTISVFAINEVNGALVAIPGSPFKTGLTPYSVTVHPSGQLLYVASSETDSVWVHRVNRDTGVLTVASGSPFASEGMDPYEVKFNAAGTLAYIPNHRSNSIAIFRVNTQDGSLVLREKVQTRSGPQKISFATGERPLSVVSRYAYAVDGAKNQLVAYRVDTATGTLKEMSRSATGKNPVAAATSTDGKFVYVANAASNTVSVYQVDAVTGKLAEVPQSPFATGQAPMSVAVDANGWFLYVANKDSNSMSVFSIDPATGMLKPISVSPVQTGAQPASVVLDSAARYAYVANAGADTISLFRYWSSDGPLVDDLKRAGAPIASGKTPIALAVDPTGNHLYAINQGANSISAYHIHFQSGLLKPITESPFLTGSAPVAIAIHPNGSTLYVVNRKSRDIFTYRRDPLSGALKELAPRMPAGEKPVSMVLDAAGGYAYVLNENTATVLKYAVNADDGRLAGAGTETISAGSVALILDRRIE